MRKIYLDNLRWVTVVIVMIYHVCFIFNGVGVLGGIPNAKSIAIFNAFTYVVYPWFMVLLFIVAGISARYSLERRTAKEFIKQRFNKLLIPSTIGLFVIHWITGCINLKMGGVLDTMPLALAYPIASLSGSGPLWFIQLLFIFSCILILLKKLDKNDKLWSLGEKVNTPIILLLAVVIYGSSQILNAPVIIVFRFGIYFASFLIGYYIFSHDNVLDMIEKICIPMLCLSVVGAVLYTLKYYGTDYTSSECLQSIYTNAYLWVCVLAIIGCFKRYFNHKTTFTQFMNKTSYGFYILHYLVVLATGYVLNYYLSLPIILNYIIAFIAEFVITYVLYEIIRRIPVLRYLILGIKGKIKSSHVANNK